MKHKSIVKDITLTGILTALAIVVGLFAHFPLFGSHVYLVGIVVLLMPLVLRLPFAIIGGILSVILTDLYTGWIAYTWISVIAYMAGIIIIYLFVKLFKIKLMFLLGLLLGSVAITLIYFVLIYVVIDQAAAYDGLIANGIQFAIVIPSCALLYLPVRIIAMR